MAAAGSAFKAVQTNLYLFQAKALCTNSNDSPLSSSRPFDEARAGFVMSEGCGVMVLEDLEHAVNRDANILAEVFFYKL